MKNPETSNMDAFHVFEGEFGNCQPFMRYHYKNNLMEILKDLSQVLYLCRLCLKKCRNGKEIIFDGDNSLKNCDEDRLPNQILICTGISVNKNGPARLCLRCLKELKAFHLFRQKCLKADADLERIYNLNGWCWTGESSFQQSPSHANKDLPDSHKEDTKFQFIESEQQNFNISEYAEMSDYSVPSIYFSDIIHSQEDNDQHIEDGVDSQTARAATIFEVKEVRNEWRQKVEKNSQKCDKWPKLKKRDLVETKAYRGLCHICGKEYQHLWVHFQAHRENTAETCDICGRGFKSKKSLTLHILMHKDAELPCDICGKLYRTKLRLRRHIRVHTNDRPFECGVCAKKFYTKYNLDVHSRSHTGQKPYSCQICFERFTHSYAYQNHLRNSHRSVESTGNRQLAL